MPAYNPDAVETKWQKHWEQTHAFAAEVSHEKPKFYPLIEFPYPSGAGLHVGHPRSNTAMDIIARKRRMEGYNVLFPIGYDAFGLPTENYAIKNKIHPAIVTEKNIARFRSQLKRLGFSFDYDREISTTDPKYYKWTQWIFLKLFEHGLAYKMEMPINWCTSCKVGLANEEVVGGRCERCGGEVVRKVKSEWMLKITEYAQKLLDGLDSVDFIEKVKVQQRNWIGRSEGAEVDFTLTTGDKLRIFTTRPDTLFGATYMVMSPEHPLLEKHRDQIENYAEICAYRDAAAHKSDFERTELNKDKTGVEIRGIRAVNPVNGQEIPVWVSDYVLMGYGTGAIMAVPAHDERDWEFARKFGLPIVEVVKGGDVEKAAYTDIQEGVLVNSGILNGLSVAQAKKTIIDWLQERGLGERKVNFKLRDWVFSRQRYWGEPIPLVHCEHCGWVPVPYDQLPLTLPEVESYMPTDNGESPLAAMTDWVNTTCPKCGGPAKRETDTMPQWAGSSWYFLRYIDPTNDQAPADPEQLKYWLPVDWYNGGMEHTTLHLLYSRFWHRFLYDIGVVPTPEPYQKRTSHGMILGADGEKMSKSRGNVVNPDQIVEELGADAFRMYEMFMGAFDQAIPWSTEGARGCRRFLDRVWRLAELLVDSDAISKDMAYDVHFTIKKVSEDYERMKYNTAIAQMMTLVNGFYAKGAVTKKELAILLQLLNPVAPHMTEEMNQLLDLGEELLHKPWPQWDERALVKDTVEIAVQINGKVRDRMDVPADLTREAAEEYFLGQENIQKLLGGKAVKKLIFVPGRLVNIVA
ncbi:MAG TPA: leucine--tRNA ligase [Candidatus Pullichristensenella excrementigallinarum]|uniref:Leucine--tRNA ligase n=1 Tax=Candidatus Pullichristensenella excrementigallinarum TaxID=2840907 RepID=A0A9D1ICX5_9FIRM|nr:leucine--tRNA ligase [Candidatus Pullichristensenella excrementigallinarum]